ncbi:MAG: glycosyltransferase family 87 protein [Gaiella sp.]
MPSRRRDPLLLALVAVAALLEGALLIAAWRNGDFAIDLRQTLLPAADKLAHGDSPYPEYGYPPLVAFLLVPFSVLSVNVAAVLYCALLAACVPVSLWMLGVRDPRCHAAAFLWAPVFSAIQTGNVTLFLVLGSAAAWALRDRRRGAALAAGIATAAKILCWPLGLWLLATRRVAGAMGAAAVALGLTFGLWATLGFDGLSSFGSGLERLGEEQAARSTTLTVLLDDLGAPGAVASAAGIGLAVSVLAGIALFGYRRDDPRAFALACVAMVVASPIVWLHSFALLLPAVAVLRPRFSPVWLLPALAFAGSGTGNGTVAQTALVLGVGITVIALSLPTAPTFNPVSRFSKAN